MEVFDRVTSSISTLTHILTDGVLTCSYQEIPEIFDEIQECFRKWGINKNSCLALECKNSLPDALILLFLLERKFSFFLLPKVTSDTQARKLPLPSFCRYSLVTENSKTLNFKNPEQFCYLIENEEWTGIHHQSNHASPTLYLQTSGSTGEPKIVVHSHVKLIRNALNCVNRLGLESKDRIAIPVPIFHMYGLGAAFLPGIAVGASIDLQPKSNLLRYLQGERNFNPNIAFMTPTFCETLLKVRKSPRKYKLTVVAGDRIRESTFTHYESKMGCLIKLYGSTEMGAIAAGNPQESSEVRLRMLGKPMLGVDMYVEVADSQAFEEIEGVGKLWCRHENGFEGYVDSRRNPLVQKTKDNWFCTEDLARIWEDGCLDVLGRCDNSVNRDGLLVIFSNVEKAIESIEGIESVIVVSKGESLRGKGIVAYILLSQNSKITTADIRAACFDIIPRRAIPDQIWIVKSFPILPNGKVDRQKLISTYEEESPILVH